MKSENIYIYLTNHVFLDVLLGIIWCDLYQNNAHISCSIIVVVCNEDYVMMVT